MDSVKTASSMKTLLIGLLLITMIHRLDAQSITVSNSRADGSSCVGDSLLFTCVANHTTYLSWLVEPVMNAGLYFEASDEIGKTFSSAGFNATLINRVQDSPDEQYADLVSTLKGTLTPELNGHSLRVWCNTSGSGNTHAFEDIGIKGPPSSPYILNASLKGDLYNITLFIQWNLQSNVTVEKFVISVYSTAINYTVHSSETKIFLSLPYNESYNISVRAVSCGEESKADTLRLNSIVGCDHPRPPENGTIKPYHSLAEGIEISYHCNTGYAPHEEMTAVCTHQGVWSHNPNELECLPDCGSPHPPLNGYVEPYNSTVEGGEVFYQCREGYSPSDVRMRAICTAEGVWNPNPPHLHCRGMMDKQHVVIISAVAGSSLLILCIFILGSLCLCLWKRHQRTTAATNEPSPVMVTVSSDPQYEEIPTQVGEERFVLTENAAYGPRPKIN